jgi:hypothetical protein
MRKRVTLFIVTLMMVSPVAAQIDPMPDGIGIYFDPGATQNCMFTSAPFQSVTAYLMATNISAPSGISGWECTVQVAGSLLAPAWAIAGGGTNFLTAPDFAVGVGTVAPLPFAPAMVLATLTAYVMNPTDLVALYVRPAPQPSIPGHPVYATGDNAYDLRALIQSTGGADFPVAAINGDCPVANESGTWGQMKALFR